MNFKIKRRRFLSTRTRSFLRWSGHFFSIIGILALSYCAFVRLDTRLYQAYQTWRFARALKGSKPAIGSVEQLHPSPLPALAEADRARVESAGPFR
jgi:hypothetical protein